MSVDGSSARGFTAAGIAAGIKENGSPDLALVVNNGPRRPAAGVFTSNRVKAAPVLWSEQVLAAARVVAVVLNSGGANACTGPQGFQDTHATAEKVAEVLGHSRRRGRRRLHRASSACCCRWTSCSPGVDKAAAALSAHGGEKAAIAIKTTDTVHKTAVAAQEGWTVGGMAKGAGMLAPGLATMLVVLTTDADSTPATLDDGAARRDPPTFDRIDSDGCMSTNDTVCCSPPGASGVAPAAEEFAEAVTEVCDDLARQLIADAEGAAQDIRIEVVTPPPRTTPSRWAARSPATTSSSAPSTARTPTGAGCWPPSAPRGRFDPDRLNVAINGVWVCKNGGVGEDRDLVDMRYREVHIIADLPPGPSPPPSGPTTSRRLRPREQRVQLMTTRRTTRHLRGHIDAAALHSPQGRRPSSRRCPG